MGIIDGRSGYYQPSPEQTAACHEDPDAKKNPSRCIREKTGSFGGVLRDLLCNTVPLIFRRELYVNIAFLSAWVYLFLYQHGVSQVMTILITLILGFSARMISIYFKLELPVFNYD